MKDFFQKNKIFIAIILGVFIIGGIIGYLSKGFISKIEKSNIVDETSKCLDIFDKKKDKYFSPVVVRQNIIFNEKLNTCLIFMQSSNLEETEMEVIDILKDKTLLFYSDGRKDYSANSEKCKYSSLFLMYFENDEKVIEEGCEKWELTNEMSEKINSFGFSFP